MKFMNRFMLIACLLGASLANAEVAVIVSADNKNTYTDVDKELIARIFLGKTGSFPDGTSAKPVNLPQGNEIREAFNKDFLGKTENQLSTYWARLRFSGKAKLPREVSSVEEMKKLIAENPELIGYIDANDVDGSIKVVHQY